MYYGNIKKYDIANGKGVRVSLFVSGCRVNCPYCFQKQTWDFHYGNEFTEEVKEDLLNSLSSSYIEGLSVLGGEPFEPENQEVLVKLYKELKERYPDKTIWSYTGYVYDKDLIKGGKKHTEYTDEILSYLDVLVDGPFIQDKKNISLSFRGSENQRLIDVKETLKQNKVITLDL